MFLELLDSTMEMNEKRQLAHQVMENENEHVQELDGEKWRMVRVLSQSMH